MVKGVARRVVVVKSPDPKEFEQAIFLLREDALSEDTPEEQVLRQAQQVANEYLRQTVPKRRKQRFLLPCLCTCVGAVAASLFWFLLL